MILAVKHELFLLTRDRMERLASLPRWLDDSHKLAATLAAAPELLEVADLVVATATVETPKELVSAAHRAIRKARITP